MRAWSRVLVAVVAVVAMPAYSRSRERLAFRVDLGSDTAAAISQPSLVRPTPAVPRAAAPLVVSYDKKRILVRTAMGKDVFQLAVGKRDEAWMPWAILQPGLLVFDWREGAGTRDVLRGFDLATGAELWRRDTPGAIGGAVGDRMLLLNTGTGTGFELVDSRTGTTVRRVSLAGYGPSTLAIDGGDTVVDTGEVIARMDARGTIAWQISKLGTIRLIDPVVPPTARYIVDTRPASPLPSTGDWLVMTGAYLVRLDAATGKVRWLVPSTATSFLVDGSQILVAEITRDPVTTAAMITLVARDLATGKTTHDVRLARYTEFFDKAHAAVVAKQGDLVEVTAELIVLD